MPEKRAGEWLWAVCVRVGWGAIDVYRRGLWVDFEMMPELEWPLGYPLVMSLMLVLAIGMLWAFREKHWI